MMGGDARLFGAALGATTALRLGRVDLKQSLAVAVATSLTMLIVAQRRRRSEEDTAAEEAAPPPPPPQGEASLGRVKSEGTLLGPWSRWAFDRRPVTPSWFADDVRLHSIEQAAVQHVALVVVDCQPVYWQEQSVVRAAFPRLPAEVSRLLARARAVLSPPQICHVRANYTFRFAQNFKRLNPEKPLPSDIQPCPWASSRVGEQIVVKSSFDSFNKTSLERYLRDLGVTDIVICGLLTSVCVLFTAQSAFASGFRVRLYEPACGDRSSSRHGQTLATYGSYCFEVFDDLDACFTWSHHAVSPTHPRLPALPDDHPADPEIDRASSSLVTTSLADLAAI